MHKIKDHSKMKSLQYLFLFCITFIIQCCGIGEWSTTLHSQKIEGTSKILYKYDAWGGMDSHSFGYVLLDSTETFEVNQSKNLPISYLEDIPNRNYILGVEFEQPKNTNQYVFTPVKINNMEEDGIGIKIKTYQNSGFLSRTQGYEEYQFESFMETRDSIYFYNLDDVKIMKPRHLNFLKFKKRNVLINQDINSVISNIVVEDLLISIRNSEIISNKTYSLTPKKKMKSNQFSNQGVFKEVNKDIVHKS